MNALSNAQRQARHRAKQRARHEALEAELAKLKAQPPPRPRPTLAELKAQATAARKAKRAEAKAAGLAAATAECPVADAPTLLAENEGLKQQLKAAQTRIRNLTRELNAMREWTGGNGEMNFATKSAIAKCIFPDQRHNATEADKDNACKQFTAWAAEAKTHWQRHR
jgi:hypothetical protein